MLDVLHAAEKDLPALLASTAGWRSFKLDRHPPVVDRMLRPYRDGKLYLHRIYSCADGAAQYHPHPWPSAMRIVQGTYELSVGYGVGALAPPVAARIIVSGSFEYEMTDANAWHSVRAIGAPAMTVMVTGPRWHRSSAADELADNDPPLLPLAEADMETMLRYYQLHYSSP